MTSKELVLRVLSIPMLVFSLIGASCGAARTAEDVNVAGSYPGCVASIIPIGDVAIRPEPTLPALPPAGKTFCDPTYGTEILRVTDRQDGKDNRNLYSSYSPFNVDNTYFWILSDGVPTLYSFDARRFSIRKQGPMVSIISFSNGIAIWSTVDPHVLYGVPGETDHRRLYAYNILTRTTSLVHDFTNEVPLGGYPFSLRMSEGDTRFSFVVSDKPSGGQDTGNAVVVYDRTSDKIYRMKNFATDPEFGFHDIHSAGLDLSGQYAQVHRVGKSQMLYWNLAANKFMTGGGGHAAAGFGKEIAVSQIAGGAIETRDLDNPSNQVIDVQVPMKNGKFQWQLESHLSWNNAPLHPEFFFWSNYHGLYITGWTQQSGSVYAEIGLIQSFSSLNAPEFVRVDGIDLSQQAAIPTLPGSWYYDSPADTLYIWLPDSTSPTAHRVAVGDWRAWQDEILKVWPDPSLTRVQRLAHHHSRVVSYADEPHAASDRSGQYVMFVSDWGLTVGGAGCRDVFIVRVPE